MRNISAFARQVTAAWWVTDKVTGHIGNPPRRDSEWVWNDPGLRYSGDVPLDMLGTALDDIDLEYRRSIGRAARPDELQALCSDVIELHRVRNIWISEVAKIADVSSQQILQLPRAVLQALRRGWLNYHNSRFPVGAPELPTPPVAAQQRWKGLVRAIITTGATLYPQVPRRPGRQQA